MSIQVTQAVDGAGKPSANLAAVFPARTMVHIQVIGPAAIRIGRFRAELEQPGSGGSQQGLTIQQGDGIISRWWIGELWVIGNAANCLYELQTMTENTEQQAQMIQSAGQVPDESFFGQEDIALDAFQAVAVAQVQKTFHKPSRPHWWPKSWLWALACLLLIARASAQVTPDCDIRLNGTVAQASLPFDNRSLGCSVWVMTVTANSSMATISAQVETATDTATGPGAFSAVSANVLPVAGCPTCNVNPVVSAPSAVAIGGVIPWARINVTALTGAGANFAIHLMGYRPAANTVTITQSNGTVTVSGTVTSNQGTGNSGANPWVNTLTQGATLLNAAPTTSAGNTAATVTLTGAAGARVCVRTIAIFASAATTVVTLTVQDGATIVLNLATPSLGVTPTLFQGQPLLCGSTGNNVVVNIGAAGGVITTTTSVIGDRQ